MTQAEAVAVLVVQSGELAGTRVAIESELVVGREGPGLTLDDPELSRRHAAIRAVQDGFEVEDLGSLNGTWVNERQVEGVVRLRAGDAIRVGTTELVFEIPGASPPTVLTTIPEAPAVAAEVARAPAQPFGVYAEGPPPRRIQSRALGPTALSVLAVVATAVALVVYFAMR